jgi:hypothetical protein
MSEPDDDDEKVNLRPGQYDEGGHGGMATRELEAKHEHEDEHEDGGTD